MTFGLSNKTLNYINFSQDEVNRLFNSSLNGDSKAFEKLSGYIRQISHSYFLSKQRKGKIKNTEDVDDLTNNVYIAFAEQYEKINNLEFWLRRVLFLTFINWYKKSKAHKTFDIDEAHYLQHHGKNPGDSVDAQKIIEMLNGMSEEKQQILKMRFWEELKFAEIAENMSKSEDAVKKMFYRTIEELKKKI